MHVLRTSTIDGIAAFLRERTQVLLQLAHPPLHRTGLRFCCRRSAETSAQDV
jgi:hypothetical protein